MSEEKAKKTESGEWDFSELGAEAVEVIGHIYKVLSKKLELIPKGENSFDIVQADFLNIHVPAVTMDSAGAPLRKMQDEFHVLKVEAIHPLYQNYIETFKIEIPDRSKFKRFGAAIYPHTLQGVLDVVSAPSRRLSPDVEKRLKESGVNMSLLQKNDRILRDEDIKTLDVAFGEGKTIVWRCAICRDKLQKFTSVGELKKYVEEIGDKSVKCKDRHENSLSVREGQIEYKHKPVPLREVLEKPKDRLSPAQPFDNANQQPIIENEDDESSNLKL